MPTTRSDVLGIKPLTPLAFDPVVVSSSEKVLACLDLLKQVTTAPSAVRRAQIGNGQIGGVWKDPEFEESRVVGPIYRGGTDWYKPIRDGGQHFQASVANDGGEQLA